MNLKGIRGKCGFTLVELMIVVLIVGIIAISAVPIYRANKRRALSAEGLAALGAIRSVQRLYQVEWNTYREVSAGEVDTVLGLDTANNHYWNNPAFAVTAGTAGIATSFIATATGAHSTAPGAAQVAGIILTMNEKGEITGP